MLTPLSWLRDFVEIKMPFAKLAERMSEVGLTVETWKKDGEDIIFDPEITPNRPDWMSVYGIAREIAAVTKTSLKRSHLTKVTPFKVRPSQDIKIKNNFELCPRYTAVAIKNVTVKSSPEWLKERLIKVGLRPINNLVDITNYVMWELGNPLHVFNLDKIRGGQMVMEETRGGEEFRSLDGINYKLPAGAIIFKDLGRVIDLCGLKGGENTAVNQETKNIFIHVPVYDPVRIRRVSKALGLRSDASAIFERGADPGNTVKTLERTVELVLDLAGGKISGGIIDEHEKSFEPWTVEMSHKKLESVLGIKIEPAKIKQIFESLGLEPDKGSTLVKIPTFRNDIHIEEDLIEEVGRIYGYNNFPKTLPANAVPTTPVAYKYDFDFDYEIKQILKGEGYTEIYSYSLVSKNQLDKLEITGVKINNPISGEYEYLRPTLLGNLLEAVKLNLPNFPEIKLFELGKEYPKEEYILGGVLTGEKFYEAKGLAEKITGAEILPTENNLNWLHPGRQAIIEKNLGFLGEVHPALLAKFGIKEKVTVFSINIDLLKKSLQKLKKYQPVPKYPSVVEDLSLIIPNKILFGEVLKIIKTSSLINNVELIDVHENSKTLRLTYLNKNKNLTDQEVALERNKILKNLKEKLKVTPT